MKWILFIPWVLVVSCSINQEQTPTSQKPNQPFVYYLIIDKSASSVEAPLPTDQLVTTLLDSVRPNDCVMISFIYEHSGSAGNKFVFRYRPDVKAMDGIEPLMAELQEQQQLAKAKEAFIKQVIELVNEPDMNRRNSAVLASLKHVAGVSKKHLVRLYFLSDMLEQSPTSRFMKSNDGGLLVNSQEEAKDAALQDIKRFSLDYDFSHVTSVVVIPPTDLLSGSEYEFIPTGYWGTLFQEFGIQTPLTVVSSRDILRNESIQ